MKGIEMEAVIQQALIKECAAAGCHDLDALKFADLANVGLDHSGNPVGVKKAVADLKATKPLFFEKPFNARTATPEEIAADAKKRGLNIKKW